MRRVWFARALARLALTAAIAFVVAAAVAALFAFVRGGEFLDTLRITALLIGAFLLLMAAGGGALSRAADAEVQQSTARSSAGSPSWTESRPDEPTISSAAVYGLSGFALIALGLVVG